MKTNAQLCIYSLLFIFLLIITACIEERVISPAPPLPPTPKPRVELNQSISGIRTLSPDTIYVLVGEVYVYRNAELIIPAGTRIEGDVNNKGFLITQQGGGSGRSGRIYALGTKEKPVVFTSSRPDGEKQRGDWGGIVLNGLGTTNVPTSVNLKDPSFGEFGGITPNDTSGILRYVRIEFAGAIYNELEKPAALALRGVGNGTVLENIQAHYALDDGIRWTGGNCNAKYLLSTGCGGELFYIHNAYNGKQQFLIGVQDRALSERGIKSDNNLPMQNPRSPLPTNCLTSPIVFNTTLIGAGVSNASSEVNDGLMFRNNTQGFYANQLVANFGAFGLVIVNPTTIEQYQNDSLVVRNSIFANKGLRGLGNPAGSSVGSGIWGAFMQSISMGYDTVDAVSGLNFFSKSEGREIRNLASSEGLVRSVNADNPMDGTKPDLRLAPNSPARIGFMTPADPTPRYPGDVANFFSPANFIGGMGDEDWTEGWTNWSLNASP